MDISHLSARDLANMVDIVDFARQLRQKRLSREASMVKLKEVPEKTLPPFELLEADEEVNMPVPVPEQVPEQVPQNSGLMPPPPIMIGSGKNSGYVRALMAGKYKTPEQDPRKVKNPSAYIKNQIDKLERDVPAPRARARGKKVKDEKAKKKEIPKNKVEEKIPKKPIFKRYYEALQDNLARLFGNKYFSQKENRTPSKKARTIVKGFLLKNGTNLELQLLKALLRDVPDMQRRFFIVELVDVGKGVIKNNLDKLESTINVAKMKLDLVERMKLYINLFVLVGEQVNDVQATLNGINNLAHLSIQFEPKKDMSLDILRRWNELYGLGTVPSLFPDEPLVEQNKEKTLEIVRGFKRQYEP